jgi:hypothetical protein
MDFARHERNGTVVVVQSGDTDQAAANLPRNIVHQLSLPYCLRIYYAFLLFATMNSMLLVAEPTDNL